MKSLDELIFNEAVRYSKEHTWARLEGDVMVVGISDYAQDQLGEIIYVDLPEAGTIYGAGDMFGCVESVKTVSDLYMPVAGEVVEINDALGDDPGPVSSSPFDQGWMIKVKPEDADSFASLLTAGEYKARLK